MRTVALVLTVVAALTAPALAEDGEPDYVGLPRLSAAFGVHGHATRIGGLSEGGFGPTIELAHGRGRWGYVVEASAATAGMQKWTTPVQQTDIDGRLLRGSLGLRWIARQFQTGSSGALELLLVSGLGVERFTFDGKYGERLTRPEVALGFAIQGRSFRSPRIAFRIDLRAVFTPDDRMDGEAGASTGFITGMAFAW